MKGITICADCAYYSLKKHKCTRGCTDNSDLKAPFFADCPLPDVKPIAEVAAITKGDKIRNASDELLAHFLANCFDCYNCPADLQFCSKSNESCISAILKWLKQEDAEK